MPYVNEDIRAQLDPEIGYVINGLRLIPSKDRAGAINYAISRLVSETIHPDGGPWSYSEITEAIAAFECAKLEFYRRIAGPKEDQAIEDNGDLLAYE